MLAELTIHDLAIITSLHLNLEQGLTAISGETGAGKSIIVDALTLMAGGRASIEMIRSGAERCMVEGVFYCQEQSLLDKALTDLGIDMESDGTLILTREVNRSGRNVCRINGRAVTLGNLQQVGRLLVDIHGQQDYQSLLRPASQRDLLDRMGGQALANILQQVAALDHRLRLVQQQHQALRPVNEQQLELWRYQLDEINKASIRPGEEEELRQEERLLAGVEELSLGIQEVDTLLRQGTTGAAVDDLLARGLAQLQRLAQIDAQLEQSARILETLIYEVEDLGQSLRRYRDNLEINPGRLADIQHRLDELARLKRKYAKNLPGIVAYGQEIAAALSEWEDNRELENRLTQELAKMEQSLQEACSQLTQSRQETAKGLEARLKDDLSVLALPHARVTIQVEPVNSPGPKGCDRITFYFSANPGEPLLPLTQVASGGETSRVMLALESLAAELEGNSTLVFDEIDSGVSGVAAQAVAAKLSAIASLRQVLCTTHSPLIAAKASNHWRVSKVVADGRTTTRVDVLAQEQRVAELARLLGGDFNSVTAQAHALELLK